MDAAVHTPDAGLSLPVTFQPTGLEFHEDLPLDRWLELGETLKSMERSVMWWIGDWVRYGERRYGETYSQALDTTDYAYQTIRNAGWVAGQIGLSRRRDNLSFSHHAEVAALAPEQQDGMLNAAESEGWTRNQLRAEVNRIKNNVSSLPGATTCSEGDLQELAEQGQRFGTIYADPPWLYGNQGTRAATGNHYGGMPVDEIAALPVARLAAENAHLHLWTTNAFLFDARSIIEAWGFTYKSCFVWVKPQMGIGNYWRVSHEFLLFGVRGDAPFRDRAQKSWLECPRGRHSAKPEQVRAIIEKASPGPYLELFGRQRVEGWTVWGNQIERNLFYQHETEAA